MRSLARRLIRAHDVFTATATDPDLYLAEDKVPSGEVWRIERYAFRLLTDEAGLVRSYIESGGDLHFINEWPAPASPFLYVDPYPVTLGEGERLALEIGGADSGDVIHLIYSGVILEERPPDSEGSAHLEE